MCTLAEIVLRFIYTFVYYLLHSCHKSFSSVVRFLKTFLTTQTGANILTSGIPAKDSIHFLHQLQWLFNSDDINCFTPDLVILQAKMCSFLNLFVLTIAT
jgi:hypothetical protein